MRLQYAAMSDRGRRERNEDSYFVGEMVGYYLFAVADGLGGHNRGDVASRTAVRVLEETAYNALKDLEPSELLIHAFQQANTAIYTYNRKNDQNAASTLSAVIIDRSGKCWIGTVGDSRTYVITPTKVWHTRDQSYVQKLVDAGVLNQTEADLHPRKNTLTQALGLEASVHVDIDVQMLAGSVLVVSSDGLHDYVPESAIQTIVTTRKPDEASQMLIDAAKDAESTDNITVIVARE